MSIIKAGLSSSVYKGLSASALISRAVKGGLQGIEWAADSHLPHGELKEAERLMMETLRKGLTISGYGSHYRIGLPDGDRGSNNMQNFKAVLDTARWLQAPLIRIWGYRSRPRGLLGKAKLYSQILDIADRAGKLGICLAIEPHPKSFLSSYKDLIEILQRAKHPYFRSCWAPIPDRGRIEGFEELGRHTALIHCRHLRLLGHIPALKDPFMPVFTEFHRQSRDTSLDYWMILDHCADDSEEEFLAEAGILKTLIKEGPQAAALGS